MSPASRTQIALIDEARCIGCARCLDACPVDAIVGAGRRMHTVVDALCTGCGLCLPPCPVDCIALRAAEPGEAWSEADLRLADARHDARIARAQRRAARPAAQPGSRRAVIEAAVARARARQRTRRSGGR
jgi:electron transport complex protein RnfB